MRLNFQISNLLHQVLSKDINIFYRESNSFFDHIIQELDCNFFSMNNKQQKSIYVTDETIGLYSYDLLMSNGILNKPKDTVDLMLHSNCLIFEHMPQNILLKKEDAAILRSNIAKYDIVLYSKTDLSFHKQHDMQYGIPLEIFDNKPVTKSNKILIRHGNENIYKMLSNHLNKKYICEEINLDCSIEEINNQLSDCSLFIELTDQYPNVLCAAAKGCKCIANQNLNHDNLDGIYYYSGIDQIIKIVEDNFDKKIDVEKNREYIDNKYNYQAFKDNTYKLIHQLSKQEAFIL
jgi:hypothetical protein